MNEGDKLDEALARYFGFGGFREGQREVISKVMAGVPTLAIMPTGAGKSLCYQLPALLLPGLTVVVSPLVALMKDQVDALRARGVAAAFINGTVSESERREALARALRGELKLLYLAPERFRVPGFTSELAKAHLALFAVDEAHCISQWGHDFRHDYSRLGEVCAHLRPPRVVALTATATPEVRGDIAAALGLQTPTVFVAGFDRPNLFLEVRPLRTARQKLTAILECAQPGGSGIVYAATRKQVEHLAHALGARGVPCGVYHAGLSPEIRSAVQERFMSGRDRVVVATNAFGMGIDKPDIRFVVHAQIPRAIEAYYQEVGRAGRDGQPARALLLFNHADVFLQERLLASGQPSPELVKRLWEQVCFEPLVRAPMAQLAAVLGAEELQVHAAVKLLERAGHLDRGVRGDGPAQISMLDRSRDKNGHLGLVLELLRAKLPDSNAAPIWIEELVGACGLAEPAVRRALLQLAREGLISYRPPFAGRALAIRDLGLPASSLRIDFQQVGLRAEQSRKLLRRMANYGYARSCRRGFILRYFGEDAPTRCERCDLCKPTARKPRPRAAGASAEESWALVSQGLSVEEVARQRTLRAETVLEHLALSARQGKPVPMARLVAQDRQARILAQARANPGARLGELHRALGDVSYGELRLTLAASR